MSSTVNNTSYRYSFGCGGITEWRSRNLDEKPTASSSNSSPSKFNNLKYKTSSNYDNLYQNSTSCMTPLLTRKKFGSPNKIWRSSSNQSSPSTNLKKKSSIIDKQQHHQSPPMLYDRRLNRSFEAPQGLSSKLNVTRRSTPHLASGDIDDSRFHTTTSRSSSTTSWCCGNFMSKQWRKVHNCE